MKKTSGIIINDEIFLNPEHIVKIRKSDLRENVGYWVEIFSTNNNQTTLTYSNREERDNAFKKIISELYGYDCCIIFENKE